MVKKRKKSYLYCRNCEKLYPLKKIKFSEKVVERKHGIIVVERGEMEGLPKTRVICPRCENMQAYWWMQQTRSGDEPPTTFYKCTKCGYAWRSYD